MATIHWQCKECKRWNQRRGIEECKPRVTLRCPGCKTPNTMLLKWVSHTDYHCHDVQVEERG